MVFLTSQASSDSTIDIKGRWVQGVQGSMSGPGGKAQGKFLEGYELNFLLKPQIRAFRLTRQKPLGQFGSSRKNVRGTLQVSHH